MSIRNNIFYNISLSILRLLFPLVTAPYIARVLGVKNVGLVNFATNYVGYFMIFAAFGNNYYGVREIAKYKNNSQRISQVFSEIFMINIISTIIVSIFYFTSIYYIPGLRKDWKIFVLAGASLYLMPISIDWYFQGLEKFKVITYRSFLIKCLSFFGLFIFVRKREDIIPYTLLSVFSIIGTYILNLVYAKRQGLKIIWREIHIKNHIRPLFTFLLLNIAINTFVTFDSLMLGLLSSYEQVGFFTSANKIIFLAVSVFSAINAALIPRIAFYRQNSNNTDINALLQKTFDLNILLIIPLAIGLCLISSRFIPLFLGIEFNGSIVPMQILSFKIIVSMVNTFFISNILLAFGYENKFLIVVFFAALFSFVLNLIFIPRYGAVATALVSITAEIFEFLIIMFFIYKFTDIRLKWMEMINSFIFTIPFIVLYFLFNKLFRNDVLFLILFIGTSISVYFFLQFFLTRNYLMIQLINSVRQRVKK
jgi:O-antigen/teichoic acid export membrane protein